MTRLGQRDTPATMPPAPQMQQVACARQLGAGAVNGTAYSAGNSSSVVPCQTPSDAGASTFYLYLYCITSVICFCFALRFLYLRLTGSRLAARSAASATHNPAQPPPEPSWKVKTGWRVLLPDASWAVAIEQSFHGWRAPQSKGGSAHDRGASSRGGSLYSAAVALGILARPLTPMLGSYSELGSSHSGPTSNDSMDGVRSSGLIPEALVLDPDAGGTRAEAEGDVESGAEAGSWPSDDAGGHATPGAAAGAAASEAEEHVHNGRLGLGAGMRGQ